MLTILSSINKLRLERDLEEASSEVSSESVNNFVRGWKRKAQGSAGADDEMDITTGDMEALREVEYAERVVVARKRLVPSSRVQKQRELMGKMGKMKRSDIGRSYWGHWRQRMKGKIRKARKRPRAVWKS
jgi:hypothetical protein